jgi:hypothetical protein
MSGERSEEYDDSGQYADVDDEEDASPNRERGNCHGRPHLIRTQNTGCAPAVPRNWIIDQKLQERVCSDAALKFARQGVIVSGWVVSTGFPDARLLQGGGNGGSEFARGGLKGYDYLIAMPRAAR